MCENTTQFTRVCMMVENDSEVGIGRPCESRRHRKDTVRASTERRGKRKLDPDRGFKIY